MRERKRRIVLHVDMDHFFTAIEERFHPEYKGKPVIVGADPKEGRGRGVVSTCNYEARKYGVKSGMPISRAWKLCPHAVYLRPNYELYLEVSRRIMEILKRYGDSFEQFGIDEAFLDVSSKVSDYEEARRLAEKIKSEIFEAEGLTCSIGVAPNKLVAKIASDFQKPDGLTVVKEEEVRSFLAPLPVRKLLWVGRKTEKKLKDMGINTIGDLANCDPSLLMEKFGAMGFQYSLMAKGIDNSPVGGDFGAVKSISRDRTFEEDTSDVKKVFETLSKLAKEIHDEVVGQNLYFKTVTVKVRYEDFETHTHSKTLPFLTNRLEDIEKNARRLLQPYLESEKRIRLVGVKVSNLFSGEKQKKLT